MSVAEKRGEEAEEDENEDAGEGRKEEETSQDETRETALQFTQSARESEPCSES